MSRAHEQWVGFSTIVMKEMTRVFRIWTQTLLPPVITTTLYFMIFGRVIGSRIGTMDGYTYVQFIAPGLIMLSIISNSYMATVSSFFSAKFQRSIEEILVSPLADSLVLLGFMTGGMLRGLLVGILVSIVAMFFTHLHIFSFFVILGVAVITSALFSLGGMINAIFAKKFDDISIIPTFVLTPLTYLGGVFYSIKSLPPVWHKISLLNPIVYIVDTFRYGFLGVYHQIVLKGFVVIILVAIALYFLALRMLKKGVNLRH